VLFRSGIIAALILPWLRGPAPDSWPFLAASSTVQVLYFTLLAAAYAQDDMSRAYPIMRGAAPLIVASVSAGVIGEPLSGGEWFGIALISLGVLALATRGATTLALANAVVIATYTVIDGLGVRRSQSPAAYTLWMCVLTGSVLLLWVLMRRRQRFLEYLRGRVPVGLAAGAGAMSSYGLALWAMTRSPVALVAALRETSIVFAALLSLLVLKERITPRRAMATLAIAAGVVALRLV
jgi:drug/metabolite transporter (DMT)-like permease